MLFTDPLDSVLGQVSKVKILRFLIRSQAQLNGREMAKAVGLSHVKCHTALRELSTHGLVTMRQVGRSLLYSLEKGNVLFKTMLKPLFESEFLLTKRLARTITAKFSKPDLLSIIVFGSTIRGDARPDSDIDVLVVVPDRKSFAKAKQAVERAEEKVVERFGNRLSPVLITRNSFRKRVKSNESLYAGIAKTGQVIYGKSVEEVLRGGR